MSKQDYASDKWTPKYQKILILYERKIPVEDIAEQVGMNKWSIYSLMQSDKFKTKQAALRDDVIEAARTKFKEYVLKAVDKLVALAESGKPDQRIQLDAAKEILYQVGLKPVEVIETRGRQYTPEEIESSLAVIKEAQKIEEKLSTRGSVFLIEKDEVASITPDAPLDIPIDLTAPSDEEKVGIPAEELPVGNV